MDYKRQMEVLDPETFNTPVHVIGAGALGSWLVLMLTKMGISDITVWDFDKIENHNVPNQAFGMHDVGKSKAISIKRLSRLLSGVNIRAKHEKVDGSQRLSGIVFMMTDTMKSRKEIYEKAIKFNPAVKLLIEGRMDYNGGRIYTIDPSNIEHIEEYEKEFYTDDESFVSACGVSQTVVATAINIASHAVWNLINWYNNFENYNEILLDVQNKHTINRDFTSMDMKVEAI